MKEIDPKESLYEVYRLLVEARDEQERKLQLLKPEREVTPERELEVQKLLDKWGTVEFAWTYFGFGHINAANVLDRVLYDVKKHIPIEDGGFNYLGFKEGFK